MTQKKTTKTSQKKTPKRKDPRGGAPGTGNPALTGAAYNTEPGDNTKYILSAMSLWNLGRIDLNDPAAIAERTNTYFTMMAEQDMKPTVVGYAMALGISRKELWAIVNDQPWNGQGKVPNLPREASDTIKNGYRTMEYLWESYMQGRKIDAIPGIFLGKNNFGYKDQSETVVVTPQNLLGSTESPAALEQKYLDSVVVEEE